MSTKSITITEDAYNRLKSLKNKKDSFSDVINRVTGRRPLSELSDLADKEEAEEIVEKVEEVREEMNEEMRDRVEEVENL